MKKILIFGLFVGAILISGCVSTTPTTPTPTVTETPTATMTETAVATMTETPTATMTETAVATTAQPTSIVNVSISNFNFVPQTVAVTNGTTVTWTNNDTVAHTVTSVTSGVFDSGPISPGATWSYTFNQTGSFEYECTIHSYIPHGTVTVT